MSLEIEPARDLGSEAGRLSATLARHPALDTWIRLTGDKTVTLYTGKVELGQGLVTAIARIGAEELDVSLDRVRVMTGNTGHQLDEQLTAGSMSVTDSGSAVRQAAAHARAHLLELAAARLGARVHHLVVDDGTVSAATRTGPSVNYWELLPDGRFAQRITQTISTKEPSEYRIIGRHGPRLDIAGLVAGTTRFVGDLQEPGMVHARVVRPLSQQGRLTDVDLEPVDGWRGRGRP